MGKHISVATFCSFKPFYFEIMLLSPDTVLTKVNILTTTRRQS